MNAKIAVAAAIVLSAAAMPARAQQAPSVDYLVGNWGVVSFNNDGDLGRMIGIARGYCNIPYRINRRSNDTFEMFVAENLREVRLMQQNNRIYIVPVEADNNVLRGAREITVRDANVFTLRYLENANHQRYGLNVFVRCGARAQR